MALYISFPVALAIDSDYSLPGNYSEIDIYIILNVSPTVGLKLIVKDIIHHININYGVKILSEILLV